MVLRMRMIQEEGTAEEEENPEVLSNFGRFRSCNKIPIIQIRF